MHKYRRSHRLFHWSSALLILGLFALGLWMRTLGYYDSWYQTAPEIHKAIGIITALLVIARFIWRLTSEMPEALDSHKTWEVKLAHIVHWTMYALVFVILVSGYLIGTADNRGIDVFGLIEIPAVITAFDRQEDIAGFIHEWVAYALIALVVLHAAGALKHHFIDKDSTLKRML